MLDAVLREPYSYNSELNSYRINAYFTRGIIRGKFKDYKGAVSDYSEAIRLDPNFRDAYYPTRNHVPPKNVEEAIEDLQEASEFFYRIGNSSLDTKTEEFIEAIQESPDSINRL